MKKIYIVDGNSFVYRMFYAIPPMNSPEWTPVNSVYGMAKFLMWLQFKDKPDYLYMVRDHKWKTFRSEMYSEYKATRDSAPDDLKVQFDIVNEMIRSTWVKVIEIEWYEADDVIGTLATNLSKEKDNMVYILSWDKDLYYLVKDNVIIRDTMKKKDFWVEETIEKFWVQPHQINDYLAIVWDKSDNIPGIDGFWPKKAEAVLNTYGSIEELYNNTEDFKGKTKEKLINSKENAFLSKKLATLVCDIDLSDLNHDDFKFKWEELVNEKSKELFINLGFKSIIWIKEVEKKLKTFPDLKLKTETITNDKDLDKLFDKLKNESKIYLDTETTDIDSMLAELVWISILTEKEEGYYINVAHNWEQTSTKSTKEFLNKLFDLDIEIIGHNLKYDLKVIENYLKTEEKEENLPQSTLF